MTYTDYFDYFDNVKAYVMDVIHNMKVDVQKPANAKLLQKALVLSELQIFQDGSDGAPKAAKILATHTKIANQLDEYIDSHSDANGNLWPVDVIRDESDLNDIKVCDYRHALVYLYKQALENE